MGASGILNIGVRARNTESLNRRIRINNLISLITVVAMIGYLPMAFYFDVIGLVLMNVFFMGSSCLSFYLNHTGKYQKSFCIASLYGLFYFVMGSVVYGTESNLHFFLIIMCLIAIVLFDNVWLLRFYILAAVAAFLVFVIFRKGVPPLISMSAQMEDAQHIVSMINLFILFIVTVIFFVFFRRENLEFQKDILFQKDIIEEKQKEILDSINYAKRIQVALFASDQLLKTNLPEHFIFFKPKDVVSGDFYWATEVSGSGFEVSGSQNQKPGTRNPKLFLLATADSTGHGVPGAIMSILNISSLENAVESGLTEPAKILNHVRKNIIERLKKDGSADGGKDGMDCSLICFDFPNQKMTYAAANNPIWIVRPLPSGAPASQAVAEVVTEPGRSAPETTAELIELSPDKMPVGKHDKDQIPFTQHEFQLQPGDVVYTLTDGIPDQFGGPKGKKFKYRQLKETLTGIYHLPMDQQLQRIQQIFNAWKGNLEQVDDICMIGLRI